MKKSNNISKLIIFFSLLVSLTACGGGSKPTSNSPTTNVDITNPETDNEIKEIYELYQQNGGKLTYEERLATIKGDKGDPGEPGKDGTSILTGSGVPDSTLGNNGDSYINLDTWDYYVKENNSWILKGNLKEESDEPIKDHNGSEGLEFYPLNEEECAVAVGTAKLLEEIIIPSTYKNFEVTQIMENGFSKSNVKSIYIPDSVTSMGMGAFFRCAFLNQVDLGNNITSISNGAFEYCDSLTSITIPNSVTSIGEVAFNHCESLIQVDLGNGVTSIGIGAFEYCTSLSSIVIPDNVTSIGRYAFENCTSLTIYCEASSKPSEWDSNWNYNNNSVYWAGEWEYDSEGNPIPKKLDEDYNYTKGLIFDENSVIGYEGTDANVVIPSEYNGYTITNIGDFAFSNCTFITSIEISNRVISIGSYAFRNCSSLMSINVPDNVTSIGNYAFYNCTSLQFNVYDDCNYLGNSLNPYIALISYKTNKSAYNINSNCKFICSTAFYNCTSLTSMVLPDSVTSIGEFAFAHCFSLTSIVIPDSVASIGGYAFNNCFTHLKIYCVVGSQPSGWDSNWNSNNHPVFWAGEWEYDSNGIPTPLL